MEIVLAVGLHDCAILLAYFTFMILVFSLPPGRCDFHRRKLSLLFKELEVVSQKNKDDDDQT
jgi:hypothetical protein